MTPARVAAASAAVVTALLLQATVVGPATFPWPVSLPAVLVAAVALADGPGTGMSFGFAIGLIADLGSHHPAGVLALCWLGVGLLCGSVADRRTVRRDAVVTGALCAVASIAVTVLLVLVHGGATMHDAVAYVLPTAAGDALLALGVIPLVRCMLRSDSLRAPRPLTADLVLDGAGG